MGWLQRMREHKARIQGEQDQADWRRGDDHLWAAMMRTNNPVFVQLWRAHQENKPEGTS